MSEHSGRIEEMKLESARRLLAAAIRLYFGKEDELATQVLATTAIALLREVRAGRGRKDGPGPEPELDGIGHLPLLMLAHSIYIELTEDGIWPEGTVLWVYYNTVEGTKEAVQEELGEFVDSLAQLSPEKRFSFCSVWIERLKQVDTAEGGSVH